MIVICPEKNFFWPYRNLFVLWCCLLSSIFYGFCTVFRKDVDFPDYLDYLNYMSIHFEDHYYFSRKSIEDLIWTQIFFECVFLVVFIMEFFTEYKLPGSSKSVKSIKLIAIHYCKTDCPLDLLALIPWNLFLHFPGSHYLFVFKVLRLRLAFKILDVKKFFN